ncbi:unnamed protein product [Arabidopsis thaliana]|uniref:(thale cress) hypothetical protein n=1 Tax=Arabidopsis thaliana TaxID=3702 RepID=A0A7G2DVM3_ARATH|nr:unnamed protein product [Arabidopsis thaliana]
MDTASLEYARRHLQGQSERYGITLLWSLMDNFEWQDGYKARFGLYYIDFQNNLTRHQKVSGKWYSEFLKPQFPTSKLREEL